MTKHALAALGLLVLGASSARSAPPAPSPMEVGAFARSAVETVLTYGGPGDLSSWTERVGRVSTPRGTDGIRLALAESGSDRVALAVAVLSDGGVAEAGVDAWNVGFPVRRAHDNGASRGSDTLDVTVRIVRTTDGLRLDRFIAR